MTLIDDRGRVGGRVNLVDALAAIVILVLIPAAYGSYLLFHTPPATLFSIEPTKIYQGRNRRIVVNGKNLRPFMRVSFNTMQGRTFLLGSTKYAEVDLPELGPGAYDVVLYNYMQEVHRLPNALTILPLAPEPTVRMDVTGAFYGLSDAFAKQIRPGTRFPPSGDVTVAEVVEVSGTAPARLHVRAGEASMDVPIEGQSELRATLRVHCFVTPDSEGTLRCSIQGPTQPLPVAPASNLALPGPQGWVNFQIAAQPSAVRGAGTLLPPAATAPAGK